MILDALTRAEHERQIEKQPDLKFVTPVKPEKKKPNKIWLYVGLGVLANALILFFIIRSLSGDAENEAPLAENNVATDKQLKQSFSNTNSNTSTIANAQQQISVPQVAPQTPVQAQVKVQAQIQNHDLAHNELGLDRMPDISQDISQDLGEDRPLAMELNTLETPEVDRPLFYESKQPNAKPAAPKVSNSATSVASSSTTKSKGRVSFSSTELSADDALPVINKPKLLIDQGNEVNNAVASIDARTQTSSGFIPKVRDLPESSRASLNQYEVNVHVYDDNPTRSFVLINMDKYKEGDRIANNGPLVEEITSEGVVIDYGSGRALLPSK